MVTTFLCPAHVEGIKSSLCIATYALYHKMLPSTTASSHGYANNAEEADVGDEGIMRDIAAANATNRVTFEQLSLTNAGMTNHITAQATLHAAEMKNM